MVLVGIQATGDSTPSSTPSDVGILAKSFFKRRRRVTTEDVGVLLAFEETDPGVFRMLTTLFLRGLGVYRVDNVTAPILSLSAMPSSFSFLPVLRRLLLLEDLFDGVSFDLFLLLLQVSGIVIESSNPAVSWEPAFFFLGVTSTSNEA